MPNPPVEALVGMWQVFRESAVGPCGVEPTAWVTGTLYFRLEADTRGGIDTYRCSSPTECIDAPSAFGQFIWREGEWVAITQTLDEPTCTIIWEMTHLAMPEPGLLRRIHNLNETSGIRADGTCGLQVFNPFTCSDETIQEATRVVN